MTVERALHARDYTPELAWRLCAWCREQGAQDFALEIIGTAPAGDAAYEELERPLRAVVLPGAQRERLTARPGQPFVRESELWALTPESLAALPAMFPRGPFDYPFGVEAWCEDLTLYRDGELLLGIISHEDWGLLRLSDLEVARLAAAGFPTRDPTVPVR